jgi:hypothetical protein
MITRRAILLALAILACALVSRPAHASFHLMQVEQVAVGVNGDVSAQAIQLRMRAAGQHLVNQARIRAWDAAGANPVLIIDLTTDVSNQVAGDRVLIATSSFQSYVSPVVPPDFIMTNPIPASYLAAGSLTFETDAGFIYWRLSWGGAAYTGLGTLNSTNNDADANANPPFASGLPYTTLQALRFSGAASALSVTNAADYAVTAGAAVWTNNGHASETATGLPGGIYPGIDLFVTPAGGATFQDFGANPIPAGFFGPGSDPFSGKVVYGGQPIAPLSPLGPTDTIVQRKAAGSLVNPGDSFVVPIEIVALNLVSVNPITVTYNGGQLPEQWNVGACLSSAAPQQQGSMTVRLGPCAPGEGGTFSSQLPVLPKLTFTRTLPSPGQATRDYGALALPPIFFQVTNGRWVPSDPGGMGLVSAPAGLSVDHDCNAGTAAKTNLPPSTNFHAGVRADHCAAVGCAGAPLVRKRLTTGQAPSAGLGFLPAAPCAAGDADGDGVCDDVDNCVAAFNPLQQDTDGDGVGNACDNCGATYNACQEDVNGNGQGDICEVAAVEPHVLGPIHLSAPYPNPTTGAMAFRVTLERDAYVRVAVYGLGGQLVRTVVNRTLPAGGHGYSWDGRGEGGVPAASGMYYLRLDADGVRQSRKFTLLR